MGNHVFDVTIQNIEGNFDFKTQLNKVEKYILLSLPSPNYQEIRSHFPHLNDIKLNDTVKKRELTVHVILGINDYAKIKMQESPRIVHGLSCHRIRKVVRSSVVFKYLCPGL